MNRNKGRTHAVVLTIKDSIEEGKSIGILGRMNPDNILSRLHSIGVNAKYEPLISTDLEGNKKEVGNIFTLNNEK